MCVGVSFQFPPVANPRFAGVLQPALGPETSCCIIYDLLSASDVSLADLANAVLLTCLAVGDAIHWFTRHRNSLHRNLQFRLFPLLELLDLLLGELCSIAQNQPSLHYDTVLVHISCDGFRSGA